MRKQMNSFSLPFVLLALILFLVIGVQSILAYEGYRLPPNVPGDFEGKWYGIHCREVPGKEFQGVRHGEAFPNQTIINSWGYKAKSIEEIKDLLPEQFYNICSHPELWGHIRVNETAYIPKDKWPGDHIKLRDAATKRYKGKPYLDERGHLRNYNAGFPFPGSTKGIELAWNFVKARNTPEVTLAKFYTAVTDKRGHSRHSTAEQNYFAWDGRLHGKEAPHWKPNPNHYDYFNTMGFKTPYDLRGIVSLTHRYDNPDKQDDMWMYLPFLRRVRRMSTAQRWDKMPGGQDITWDAATGFDGKPTNYDWKYLGRKVFLCGHQGIDQLQEIKDKPGGGTCDQLYQRVDCLLVEYLPKIVSSVSRAVMYLDSESYCCYYVEFFDKRGRPYLFFQHSFVVHGDGNTSPIGFFVADVQRTHSSNNYTYDVWHNEDAIAKGIIPSYFEMNNLQKIFKGR